MDNKYQIEARIFAAAAHGAMKQKRKYTGEDYIFHPIEVADIIREHAPDWAVDQVFAIALLHDVLEDTGVTVEYLSNYFPSEIVRSVVDLTDVSNPSDGNRAVRKELDRQHLAHGSGIVHTVKLADLISNTRSIIKNDPGFAPKYVGEKKALMHVLTRGSDKLKKIAWDMINEFERTKP